HSHSRRRYLKKGASPTRKSLESSPRQGEFSRIPTIPAEIRTSPNAICGLLTIAMSRATASTNRRLGELISVPSGKSFNSGGKVDGNSWIVSHARSTRRQGG